MSEAKRAELVPVEAEMADDAERIEADTDEINIGEWYWITTKESGRVDPDDEDYDPDEADEPGKSYYAEWEEEWLGCIVHVGTNYVKIEGPGKNGRALRIHLDAVHERLRFEPNAQDVIRRKAAAAQQEANSLMRKVQEITRRLGVSPRVGLPDKGGRKPAGESYALATVSASGQDMKDYKASLVRAKEEELPELFRQIEAAHQELAVWMTAETLPMKAAASRMKGCIGDVEDRIFNVSLYAGLIEEVVQVADGEPAGFDEKLHLYQRRCYMDEECLVNYEAGGMEFRDIDKFDAWLARPENRDRILPHPRGMVSFRVRRRKKDRGPVKNLSDAFIRIELEALDKMTFLYIRNGEQLWRLNSELEFDDLLFPSKEEFDLTEEMVIHVECGRIQEIRPKREHDAIIEAYEERIRAAKRWRRKNPFKRWRREWVKARLVDPSIPEEEWDDDTMVWHKADKREKDSAQSKLGRWNLKYKWERAGPRMPSSWDDPRQERWQPFTPASVWYDDANDQIKAKIQHYNRVALIIQGLYDRSEVLHPHPPAKTWTPEGFHQSIELVYDGSNVLYDGDAPDFDEYCAELRAQLDRDSVTIGQEGVWMRHVQEKEEERRRNSMYSRDYRDVSSWWKPHGDPGPGVMAKIDKWSPKHRKATYSWMRQRRGRGYFGSDEHDLVRETFSVDADKLFNVSAYKPGDYKRFFADPRTRPLYLRWANLMLRAEDYHAGKREAQQPVEVVKLPSLKILAQRLQAHLTKLDQDEEFNVEREDSFGRKRKHLDRPRVTASKRFVDIDNRWRYVTSHHLSKAQAWAYLMWLDAGNKGTYYDFRVAVKPDEAEPEEDDYEDYGYDEDDDD